MQFPTTVDGTRGFRFQNVLVPHDFTAASDCAAACAADLARAAGGVVHLLHVLPAPAGSLVVDATPLVWAAASLLDARDTAARRLEALGDGLASPAEVHVAVGAAAAQICETAEHVRAGLIVMALHTPRARAGGIAATTLDRARCPVLVVGVAAHRSSAEFPASPDFH
jgi:nucleotide-binding universal stress UspA family protein